jgi:hypothetical protein
MAAGCPAPKSILHGTVRLGGQNVTGGTVILYCEGREVIHGVIAEDGTYSVTNLPRGRAIVTVRMDPRVPPGLRLSQNLPPTTPDGPKSPSAGAYAREEEMHIPLRYASPEGSGLSVIIDRPTQEFDIELLP